MPSQSPKKARSRTPRVKIPNSPKFFAVWIGNSARWNQVDDDDGLGSQHDPMEGTSQPPTRGVSIEEFDHLDNNLNTTLHNQ